MANLSTRLRPLCAMLVAAALFATSASAASAPPWLRSTPPTASTPVDPGVVLADQRRTYRTQRDRYRRQADRDRRHWHRDRDRDRRHRYADRHDRRWHDRDWDRPRYKRGYRGSRTYRKGHRRDRDGWWFPLAAFALGAIIIEQQNQRRSYTPTHRGWDHIPAGNMHAHDEWCERRYRSYSRSTKTFQPYDGPRRYCNSPYDLY